jgi:hypothetical protein
MERLAVGGLAIVRDAVVGNARQTHETDTVIMRRSSGMFSPHQARFQSAQGMSVPEGHGNPSGWGEEGEHLAW